MKQKRALRDLADNLARGEVSFSNLIGDRLAMARLQPDVFVSVNEGARDVAAALDQQRGSDSLPPFAGVPLSIKDLFDLEGERTLAGSKVLQQYARPAARDADVVAPLRNAGMVMLGRTNMSEFAFSGMGINPHYPPLYSVWDRATRRLPGGSSSGSAVSVALGIVPGTLGSDTAGSCRIPAAFNGITGFKPSYGRLSGKGVYPLSHSSDAPGPLGADVDTCFVLDWLMAGGSPIAVPALEGRAPEAMTLLIPDGSVMSDLDEAVQTTFERGVESLEQAGVKILRQPLDGLDDCVDMFLNRPVAVYEAWQHHARMLEERGDEYDPYGRVRITSGQSISEVDQRARYEEKAGLIERVKASFQASGADAVIYPTVACLPPPMSATEDPEKIGAVNLRCLRNTASVNYFDGCAISVPCNRVGEAPVGFMISAMHGADADLFPLAATVEDVLGAVS